MSTIAELSDIPQYTIKAVCTQTGIRAVTLRAWERRYQLLNPHRSENQYRRYSEREVALLRWVKNRVDSGISISSAVAELNHMLQKGQWPEAIPSLPVARGKIATQPPEHYAKELYKALICHDESTAAELFEELQASYELDVTCSRVLTPVLVEIGEGWFRGDLRIATEHFASNFVRGKLSAIYQALPTRRSAPFVLTGCAPGEHHELGVLMLSTYLRNEGYRVEYLGQDVPLDDLVEYASFEKPALICLSAATERPALALAGFQEQLSRVRPTPMFAYGGQAFNRTPALRARVPGIFMGENAPEALVTLRKLLAIS